jgi:hypothetical protein
MKKITLVMALLCAISLFAQKRIPAKVQELVNNNTAFRAVAPLQATAVRNAKADKLVNNATYATLNETLVRQIANNKYPFIELSIPYKGQNVTMLLYRTEVTAEGFHVDTDKRSSVPYTTGAYYRGVVKGNYKSVAAFSFFQNGMTGIVSSNEFQNLVVGKMKTAGQDDYIIYSDAEMNVLSDFKCKADENKILPDFQPKQNTFRNVESEHCVTIYFEIDYSLYAQNRSDVAITTDWMTGLFNNVQALYDNDGITTALKSVFVWTEPDPYDGGLGSSDYLYSFYANRPSFDGDAGMLIGDDEGGLGGVAITIGGLCSSQNVSYSDVFFFYEDIPVFSWNVEVVTHELGHLFGSPHTHGCYWNGNNTAIDGCGTSAGYREGNCEIGPIPDAETGGSIMSYCHLVDGSGINFANGFGPQPALRIQNHLAYSMCLSTDCINTCTNDIVAIEVTDVKDNTISLRLQYPDDGQAHGPWQVAYTRYGQAPNNWVLTSDPDILLSNLDANSYYNIAVRRMCNDVQVTAAQLLTVMTAGDWCAGTVWKDPDGNSDYSDEQKIVRIIKSQDPGTILTVTFDLFETEPEYDSMYVYDGIGTTAPLLGVYNGYYGPEPFTTDNADHALTYVFISDQFITGAGWEASIECSLATQQNTYTNLGYYPNPVSNKLTISSTEGITHVAIYNVAGQLLFESKISTTTSYQADMAGYATGIYLVKVGNGNNNTTLKVIKN